ncbi:MAG TPA: amidohydrolase family protein [Solirubrobacterales bacterium]|nr:amidohydrolase family protein [Solirubrobacterales bacterium]
MKLVVRGGEVLVGDPGDGRFERADVVVDDGVIAAVEPDAAAGDAQVVDAGGALVLPGFVDTHRHTWQTAMRGVCADWTLLDYFRGIRLQISTAFGPQDVYAGNYAGALEALDSGVTTLLDFSHCLNSPEHADEAVRGLRDAGVRGIWAYGMFPVPLPEPVFATPDDRLADARRVRERHFSAAGDTLDMGVALTELGLVPFDVTRAEVALARELDVMVTAHTGTVTSAQRPPEVELLQSAGLLDHRQVHVHCNACSNRELDLLADAGASVSLTPETELQMGMGFPIFARALERGLAPSLGCDIVSNNRGDLFAQMRLGLQAERARANQARLDDLEMPQALTLGVRDVLRFATLGGAEALGLGSVCGSIEAGKAADLLLIRTDSLHLAPLNDPVATVVLHAGPDDVDTVLVGGRVVKESGVLTGAPADRARSLVEASRDRIVADLEPRGGLLPPAPEGWFEVTTQVMAQNLADAAVS